MAERSFSSVRRRALTARERECLCFLAMRSATQALAPNTYEGDPSHREIAHALGMKSRSQAGLMLLRLKQMGYLQEYGAAIIRTQHIQSFQEATPQQ